MEVLANGRCMYRVIINTTIPPTVIPNFSATLGKRPRSTIPKDKFLFEYLLRETGEAIIGN